MDTVFSGKRAYEHLKVLAADIGPRHGGSSSEARAARYIRDYFKSIGLRARLVSYPIYSFESAEAKLTTPRGKSIPCSPIPMTASTSARGITREVIFLEGCEAAYLDGRVRNKIVVMFGKFVGALQEQFHAYEPAGVVSVQTNAHQKHAGAPIKADGKRKIGSIPSVCLTFDDGMALIKNLPRKLTLKVVTKDERVRKGYNVVADLPGKEKDGDIIAICAYYDSVWIGPGAFDNGGGAAAIMELARVYAKKGSRYPMRFLAFGGEEMGVWGSRSYVKNLKDENDRLKKDKNFELDGLRSEMDRHRFLVNIDMAGPFYGKSNAIALGDRDIGASVRLHSNEQRYAIGIREDSVYSSDNMCFNYAGIPSLSFNRCGFGDLGGHTAGDVIDNCSPEGLAHISEFVESWIDRYLLGMHTFPFTRTLPESAKKGVDSWYKGKGNPLDYEVLGPEKKYRPSKKKPAKRGK